MALAPATRLGPYKVLAPLGAGGMGEVYRARDERLEREVAIKVLPQGMLIDEAARRRFRTEALALAKLNHPNIAAVYDVGEQGGRDYLVMEYVQGPSLAEKLKSGPLSVREAVSLGEEIAMALQEAHEQGVVHRDLKPGNVIITPRGHAKVLDFGLLAKLLAPEGSGETTLSYAETRGPVGTPLYMSPEQAEGKSVDSRSDLWSLGVLLYESLAGRAPFRGNSNLELLRVITLENPKPLREICAGIPAEADRIVGRAMEKDLTKRYQSASEMAQDISAVLTQLSAPAPLNARRKARTLFAYRVGIGFILVLLGVSGARLYHRMARRHWAREEAIPGIANLQNERKSLAAFLLLEEARRYLPGDPQLAKIAEESTRQASITSSPSGATVEIQDYLSPDGAWLRLGTTPLKNLRIPKGYFRWRVSKQGVGEYMAAPITEERMNFSLESANGAPEGMGWVEGGEWGDFIDFVGWMGPFNIPAFYIDRYEVTNRQYQEFVDNGGYQKREYWNQEQDYSWRRPQPLLCENLLGNEVLFASEVRKREKSTPENPQET